MTVHRIRLRGHWTATPLEGGRTRLARRFGQPRTGPGEAVWVTGVGFAGPVTVFLNGQPLGTAAGQFALDVTSVLHPRNEIALELSGSAGEVAVEIRPVGPGSLPGAV